MPIQWFVKVFVVQEESGGREGGDGKWMGRVEEQERIMIMQEHPAGQTMRCLREGREVQEEGTTCRATSNKKNEKQRGIFSKCQICNH